MISPYSPPDSVSKESPSGVRPRAFIAALLAVTTGAGHYYAGARWRFVWVALALPVALLSGAAFVRTMPLVWGPALLYIPFLAVDAYRQARKPDARRPPWPEILGVILVSFIYFQGVSGLFRGFVTEPFSIPAASMAPTLLPGDYILVDKLAYFGSPPQRGDIVVFKYPDDPSVNYVKRIIGLPGDRVTVTAEDQVQINGATLAQVDVGTYSHAGIQGSLLREEHAPGRSHLILHDGSLGSPKREQTWRVPAGAYFMLGDNRDHSRDSRFWIHSFVLRDVVLGRAVYRHLSTDPETGEVRFERIGPLQDAEPPGETTSTPGP